MGVSAPYHLPPTSGNQQRFKRQTQAGKAGKAHSPAHPHLLHQGQVPVFYSCSKPTTQRNPGIHSFSLRLQTSFLNLSLKNNLDFARFPQTLKTVTCRKGQGAQSGSGRPGAGSASLRASFRKRTLMKQDPMVVESMVAAT